MQDICDKLEECKIGGGATGMGRGFQIRRCILDLTSFGERECITTTLKMMSHSNFAQFDC